VPRVGVAVGAALLLAIAATLILGIIPSGLLGAAEAGAHTLEPLPAAQPNDRPILIAPIPTQ
jgi:hypothetical protein